MFIYTEQKFSRNKMLILFTIFGVFTLYIVV